MTALDDLELVPGENLVTDVVAPGRPGPRSSWQARWSSVSPGGRTRVQLAVLLGLIVVAYHYSLMTLFQSLNLDTPLAYVGLTPLIALGLAAVRSKQAATELPIHDRQVDYIIGVPLLGTALAINVLLPRRMSAMFWVWRIDLLSLPFFVAGATAVIFGVRALWRQRLAVSYLLLAWPLPYSVLLVRQLNAITNLTLGALRILVPIAHVGSQTPGPDRSIFNIVHHGQAFPISVVSACSGVNGMVGFLLVGAAFGATVTGPKLRKTLWLGGGLLLLWIINVGRLLLIFWVGQEFGEHFAINVLHPFVGLVTFNLGIVIMVLLLKPAGLRIGGGLKPEASEAKANRGGTTGGTAPPLAVPRLNAAFTLVVVLGLVLALMNTNLSRYNLVARADGEPKLASFLLHPASPAGWKATYTTHYDFAKPFFGESSAWYRYVYGPGIGQSDLHGSTSVVADVVNTSDLSSFSAYGVEACYRFHGYSLRAVRQVSLGGGITGQTLSYTAGRGRQDWSIAYWIWPVKNGPSIRYERVILYGLNSAVVSVNQPGTAAPQNGANASTHDGAQSERDFLVAFAREIVHAQAGIPIGLTSAQFGVGGLPPRSLRDRSVTTPPKK